MASENQMFNHPVHGRELSNPPALEPKPSDSSDSASPEKLERLLLEVQKDAVAIYRASPADLSDWILKREIMVKRIEALFAPKPKPSEKLPMGVTNWIEHGKKYGYYDFAIAAERLRAVEAFAMDLKLTHGAAIGIDGRRIDNMVHHTIIDERLAKWRKQQ